MALQLTSRVRLASGHLMPIIGLGVYQNYTTKESVLEALRAGYRLIDTAQAYKNEAHVGEAIRESEIAREDIFVITKCVSKTHGYESTLQGVDASLERLGFSYIDLFLIHDPFSGTERRLATYRALQDSKRAGKIRDVGVSNYGIHHLDEVKAAGYDLPAVNQIELHPFCQQRPIVEYCFKHNIIIQAYSPLVRGNVDHPVVRGIAKSLNRDPGQILVRWSLQKGFIPLPKSAQPGRIASNIDVFGFELSPVNMYELDRRDQGDKGAVTWNPVSFP